MLTPDEAGKVARKYAGWAMLGLAVILAPAIYAAAINFVEMLWAVVAAGVSLAVVWSLAPAAMDWAANMRIEAVKAVARANPIATMDNVIMSTRTDLLEQKKSVIAVDTQWENVKKILRNLRVTDPQEADAMQESEELLHQASSDLHEKYDQATTALDVYIKARDKANRLWLASVAINKALEIAGAARDNEMARIKSVVAFEEVDSNMSKAMAGLRMAITKHKPGEVVQGEVVPPKELPPAQPSFTDVAQLRSKKETAR